MKNAQSLTAFLAIVLLWLVATPSIATETVSPGAIDRMAQVNNACPTFSWDGEAGAVMNEMVACAIHEGGRCAQRKVPPQIRRSEIETGCASRFALQ